MKIIITLISIISIAYLWMDSKKEVSFDGNHKEQLLKLEQYFQEKFNIHKEQQIRKIKIAVIDSNSDNLPLANVIKVEYSKDLKSHGNHIVGIINAINPNAEIIHYGVLVNNDNSKTIENTLKALQDCIDKKVDIINISMNGLLNANNSIDYFKEFELYQKIKNNNIPVIVSSGNESLSLNTTNCNVYPSCYGIILDNIFSVGSLNDNKQISEFSNIGGMINNFEIGEDIISITSFDYKNKKYKFEKLSGTSQSTAIVTGLISLKMAAIKEKMLISQIKSELHNINKVDSMVVIKEIEERKKKNTERNISTNE